MDSLPKEFELAREILKRSEQTAVERAQDNYNLRMISILLDVDQDKVLQYCNVEVIRSLIYNSSWEKRLAALFGICEDLDACHELEHLVYNLAANDESPQVQGVAMMTLGKMYGLTKDREIGSFLAKIVNDERKTQDLRVAAYFGLLFVDGTDIPMCLTLKDRFNAIDDSIVAKYGLMSDV